MKILDIKSQANEFNNNSTSPEIYENTNEELLS
jgi:hypothetical protein